MLLVGGMALGNSFSTPSLCLGNPQLYEAAGHRSIYFSIVPWPWILCSHSNNNNKMVQHGEIVQRGRAGALVRRRVKPLDPAVPEAVSSETFPPPRTGKCPMLSLAAMRIQMNMLLHLLHHLHGRPQNLSVENRPGCPPETSEGGSVHL